MVSKTGFFVPGRFQIVLQFDTNNVKISKINDAVFDT